MKVDDILCAQKLQSLSRMDLPPAIYMSKGDKPIAVFGMEDDGNGN